MHDELGVWWRAGHLLSPLGDEQKSWLVTWSSNLPASQPDRPGKQLGFLVFLTRICSLQRWAVSAGRRASVRINRNKKETTQGLDFYQVTAIALYGGCRDAGQIVELPRLRKVDRPFLRGTGSLFRKPRERVLK